MHGIVFSELKGYVDQRLGGDAWAELLRDAGLGRKIYLPIKAYPDEDVVAIVGAASARTGLSAPALLEDFGQYIAGGLLAMYRHLIRKEWTALDVIEFAEPTVHRIVRKEHAEAAPPYLTAMRVADNVVHVHYDSSRRLCHVAKGIVRGIAAHYGEEVAIEEPRCMHHGAAECLLVIESRRAA